MYSILIKETIHMTRKTFFSKHAVGEVRAKDKIERLGMCPPRLFFRRRRCHRTEGVGAKKGGSPQLSFVLTALAAFDYTAACRDVAGKQWREGASPQDYREPLVDMGRLSG
jgi:hypothetical protein